MVNNSIRSSLADIEILDAHPHDGSVGSAPVGTRDGAEREEVIDAAVWLR